MSEVDLSVFEDFGKAFYANFKEDVLDSKFFYQLFRDELYDFYLPYNFGESKDAYLKAVEPYDYKWIDGQVGGEGSGEYCWGVIRFKGKHYKAEWTYYSYNGCEYEDIISTIREVKPVEKLITVYE